MENHRNCHNLQWNWRNAYIYNHRVLFVVLGAIIGLFVRPARAEAQKTIRRVAVLDFQNITGDKDLERFTLGIPDAISNELLRVHSLEVVERKRINDTLQEVRLQQSRMVDRATAKRAGKLIGADSLVVGSFQKWGEHIQLTSRVIDVETNLNRAPVLVEGSLKDLFKLQAQLAKEIVIAIEGAITEADRETLDQVTARRLDAFEAFSDGLYFLRKDQPANALAKFELTLAIDPGYPGVQYYRGVTLEKLKRFDDAIAALLKALPHAEPDPQPVWTWQAPNNARLIRGMDLLQTHLVRDYFALPGTTTYQKQIIYAEPGKSATTLYCLDPESRQMQQVGLPEESVSSLAHANNRMAVLLSPDVPDPKIIPPQIRLYGFRAPGCSLAWQQQLSDYGNERPRLGLISDQRFYVYLGGLSRLQMRDAETGEVVWSRDGLALDRLDPPLLRQTEAYGDILIAQAGSTYKAIRVSDGSDAWSVTARSGDSSDLADDHVLVTLEPGIGVGITDLESGKTLGQVPITPFADTLATPAGPKVIVAAVLDSERLYVLSKDLQLHGIDLRTAAILWKTALSKRPQSMRAFGAHVYLGTDSGEVLTLNAETGAIAGTTKVSAQTAVIYHAGDDGLVVLSNGVIFGLSPDGSKVWEHKLNFPRPDINYFNGAITLRSPDVELSAIDVKTGKTLLQIPGKPTPITFTALDRLFLLRPGSVEEYPIDRVSEGVTEEQALTELATVYLDKEDLASAADFVGRAGAIDRNYPPFLLVHAGLLRAQGERDQAGRELARYASLVGFDSIAGQNAVAQLKREHGLLWHTSVGADIAGSPVLTGDRLVSVGQRVGASHIVALNAESGRVVWKQAAARFVASVADQRFLWSVTGAEFDPNVVILRRTDIATGSVAEVARWHNPARVHEAWIAFAAGRAFVATASPDVNNGILQVRIRCLDATTGATLWQKNDERKVSMIGLLRPLSGFAVHDDGLTYETAGERYTLGIKDGTPVPAVATATGQTTDSGASEISLWDAAAFTKGSGRVYAFTADGHAFAKSLQR